MFQRSPPPSGTSDTDALPLFGAAFARMKGQRSRKRVSGASALDGAQVSAGPLMASAQLDRFAQLCKLAHARGLHVAPEVSLGALFTVGSGQDGQASGGIAKALRNKHVDFVLLDGAAQPVLALDYCGESSWRGRAIRRDNLKRRAFEKAGIPLVALGDAADWPADQTNIEALLDAAGLVVAA